MDKKTVAIIIIIIGVILFGVTQLFISSNNDSLHRYRDYCSYGYTVILGSIDCKSFSEFQEMIGKTMYRDYNDKGYDDKVIRIDKIQWSIYSEVWNLKYDTPDSCNAKENWKQTNENNTNIGFCRPTVVSGYSLEPFFPVTNISYFEGKVIESSWQVWTKDQEIIFESGKSFSFDETTDVTIGSVITIKKTQVLTECLISDVGIESAFGSSNLIGNGTNDGYLWNFIRNGNDTVYEMRASFSYHFNYNEDYDRKERNCKLEHGDVTTFEIFEVQK